MSTRQYGRSLLSRFLLDRSAAHLNHGSYGATPRAVVAAQKRWRIRLERAPMRFMAEILPSALRQAAQNLAGFLGTRGDQLAFVENATTAVNTILAAQVWRRGDEILTTDHGYPGVDSAVRHYALRSGAVVRQVRLPAQIRSQGDIVDAVTASVSDRTRMLVVDHVCSRSALVMPVGKLCSTMRARGVKVLIDGAHAPGMLSLNLDSLGADWYAGNCHKWLCSPKGCGFVWSARDNRSGLLPLVISNRNGEGFPYEFDWPGTRDPSAWLSVSAALEFHRRLGGALLRTRNRRLAYRSARMLAHAWNVELPLPASLLGAMVELPLPVCRGTGLLAQTFMRRLWKEHRIEIPVWHRDNKLFARISVFAYNDASDFERLASAVLQIIRRLKLQA